MMAQYDSRDEKDAPKYLMKQRVGIASALSILWIGYVDGCCYPTAS